MSGQGEIDRQAERERRDVVHIVGDNVGQLPGKVVQTRNMILPRNPADQALLPHNTKTLIGARMGVT